MLSGEWIRSIDRKITQSSPLSMASAVAISGSRRPLETRRWKVPASHTGWSVEMSFIAQPILSGAASASRAAVSITIAKSFFIAFLLSG